MAPCAASGFQAANSLNRFVVSSWMPFSWSDGGTVPLVSVIRNCGGAPGRRG